MLAYEIPAYYICGKCGYALQNTTMYKESVVGQATFACVNFECEQHHKPHVIRFRELTLTETPPAQEN